MQMLTAGLLLGLQILKKHTIIQDKLKKTTSVGLSFIGLMNLCVREH